MTRCFIDTAYLIAILTESDESHEKALQFEESLTGVPFVTSQLVLLELLNHFCEQGKFWRKFALQAVRQIENDPRTELIPMTGGLFRAASEFYGKRMDKGYSLTDCSSMLIMKDKHISTCLTSDRHFLQEGFKALLLE